ncbi:MAG: hypothetical protein HYZ85_05350 [Candidatus Omnitrophica bacterium]|nr:hypothetical protein [Candidatus Omnitrophota bacterium]
MVLFCGCLHLSAVLKKDDPVVKTQTDPISMREKMEEIKGGVKSAPSPSHKHYSGEDFFTESAVGQKEVKASESSQEEAVWKDEELELISFDEEEESLEFWEDDIFEEEFEEEGDEKGVKEDGNLDETQLN